MRLSVSLIKTYRFAELFKRLCILAVSAVDAGKLEGISYTALKGG